MVGRNADYGRSVGKSTSLHGQKSTPKFLALLQFYTSLFSLVLVLVGQLAFLSVSILFQTILSNDRLDRSKLDEKEHKVVKSPTAIAGSQALCHFDLDQLNLDKFSSS